MNNYLKKHVGVLSHLKWHDTSKLEKWKWKLDLLKIRRPQPISWGKVPWTIQSVSTTHQTSQKWYNQATPDKSTYTSPAGSFHPVFLGIFFSGLFIFTKVRSAKGGLSLLKFIKTSSQFHHSRVPKFLLQDWRAPKFCSLTKPSPQWPSPFKMWPQQKRRHRENTCCNTSWTRTMGPRTDNNSPSLEGRWWWREELQMRDVKSPGYSWWLNQPT